jgi:hypothetical protein
VTSRAAGHARWTLNEQCHNMYSMYASNDERQPRFRFEFRMPGPLRHPLARLIFLPIRLRGGNLEAKFGSRPRGRPPHRQNQGRAPWMKGRRRIARADQHSGADTLRCARAQLARTFRPKSRHPALHRDHVWQPSFSHATAATSGLAGSPGYSVNSAPQMSDNLISPPAK